MAQDDPKVVQNGPMMGRDGHRMTPKSQMTRGWRSQVAQSLGKLKRGSGLDMQAAARGVLQDWTAGKEMDLLAHPPRI